MVLSHRRDRIFRVWGEGELPVGQQSCPRVCLAQTQPPAGRSCTSQSGHSQGKAECPRPAGCSDAAKGSWRGDPGAPDPSLGGSQQLQHIPHGSLGSCSGATGEYFKPAPHPGPQDVLKPQIPGSLSTAGGRFAFGLLKATVRALPWAPLIACEETNGE